MDERSQNYSKYFIKGNKLLDNNKNYNSNNTKMLTVKEIIQFLKKNIIDKNFLND